MITPSWRKVSEGERKKERRDKNDVNSGHLVRDSARKPLGVKLGVR